MDGGFKIQHYSDGSSSTRGAARDQSRRGTGCGGRGKRRKTATHPLPKVLATGTSRDDLGGRLRGRRNRGVLTPGTLRQVLTIRSAGAVAKRPRQGGARKAVNHWQGMPGGFQVMHTWWTLRSPCCFFTLALFEDGGVFCIVTARYPAPSFSREPVFCKPRARSRRRTRTACFSSLRAKRSNHLARHRRMDCFATLA